MMITTTRQNETTKQPKTLNSKASEVLEWNQPPQTSHHEPPKAKPIVIVWLHFTHHLEPHLPFRGVGPHRLARGIIAV